MRLVPFILTAACTVPRSSSTPATVTGSTVSVDTGAPDGTNGDAAFASDLTLGYTCGPGSYTAFDPDRTLRLQSNFGNRYTNPSPVDVTFELPAESADGSLQLYFGTCLLTPGCTDDPNSRGCDQEIDSAFDAVSGTIRLTQGADLSVSATLTDVVLEGRNGEAPLEIAELDLPSVPLWVTYTY